MIELKHALQRYSLRLTLYLKIKAASFHKDVKNQMQKLDEKKHGILS